MFDSRKEAEHAKNLDVCRHATNLSQRVVKVEYQVKYPIVIQSTYIADFVVTFADGHVEVQDTKGFLTKEYKQKKKLVKAQHGVDIIEI